MHEDSISHEYLAPSRSLREACRRLGLDHAGARCPDCPVRDLCEDEERWLVKRNAKPTRH